MSLLLTINTDQLRLFGGGEGDDGKKKIETETYCFTVGILKHTHFGLKWGPAF